MITPMDGFTVPAGEETVLEPAMLPANDDPGEGGSGGLADALLVSLIGVALVAVSRRRREASVPNNELNRRS